VRPDVVTMAKALGNGVPIGALWADEQVAVFEPGDHATTFGGQPLATAAARAVLAVMEREHVPERAVKAGEEPVGRTMLVAIGVALFCSAMVTVAVHVLRPVQAAYAAVERNRAIVEAAGLAPAEAADDAVVREFLSLDAVVIELATGAVVEGVDGHAFDHWAAAAAAAAAGDARPTQMPIYLRRESGALVRVVLPVTGPLPSGR